VSKNLTGFAIAAAVTAVAVYVFWAFFEILPVEKDVAPSREARINEYLALDRWLGENALTERIENAGSIETIKAAPEKTVFIQSNLFEWTSEAIEYLTSWIDAGGNLIVSVNWTWSWEDDGDNFLLSFMKDLGLAEGEWPEDWNYYYDPHEPDYGDSIIFAEPEDKGALVFRDYQGLIKMVRLSHGRGKIAVMGEPYFMMSHNIGLRQNARLAWHLLAGEGGSVPGDGVFFIRGRQRVTGLFGRLFEQGNFFALIASAVVLVIIGFWAAIPVFGVVKQDGIMPGRPLRERFLAEGMFLKSHGALDSTRAVYVREIKRRLLSKEGIDDEHEILRRAGELWAAATGRRDTAAVEDALSPSRKRPGDFPKMIVILKTIMERL
jgi:hypothetical protein